MFVTTTVVTPTKVQGLPECDGGGMGVGLMNLFIGNSYVRDDYRRRSYKGARVHSVLDGRRGIQKCAWIN